jgi:cytosine/adenosine deaminase-related metal-dependent hydrolase
LTETVLLKNAFIVTMDEQRRIIERGYVKIDDGKIESVNRGYSRGSADTVIDARGKIAIPGLICTHNHMYGILTHGMPVRKPPSSFYQFLQDFWWPHVEYQIGEQEITAATQMACTLMAKTGTTTFADILEAPNSVPGALETEARVVEKSGLRGTLSFEASERAGGSKADDALNENARFIEKRNHRESKVRGMMCTHTIFTCSKEFLERARDLAGKLQVGIQIHLEEGRYESEYSTQRHGKLPVEVYEEIGFLNSELLASQCVHTQPREAEILKKYDVKLSHMPISNCEVGGGIAPVPEFLQAGLTVGLGTDGYVTDMFEVMRAAFLIHKARLENASIMPAPVVFEMATVDGAKALGLEKRVGSIEVGKQADIVLLDSKKFPTPITPENAYSQLVAHGNGEDVDTVLVSGETIVEKGEMKTLDERRAVRECSRTALQLWNKSQN